MNLAVIGSGLAGLSCASTLDVSGMNVTCFDKGRGPGGRMSTRRVATPLGEVRFDHGTPYIAPSRDGIAGWLDHLVTTGRAGVWHGRFAHFDVAGEKLPSSGAKRIVGIPGMNEIVRAATDGLKVQFSRRVTEITGRPGELTLEFEDGSREGPFDGVVVAVPAEQVAPLLSGLAAEPAGFAGAVESLACWAGMFAFDRRLDLPFDGAKFDAGPIGWMSRENSKPGRSAVEAWTVHASYPTSKVWLEDTPEVVLARLLETLRKLSPNVPDPIFAAAHRWRYALPGLPAPIDHTWDAKLGIGTCGDWHAGTCASDAWQSGQSLASAILAGL